MAQAADSRTVTVDGHRLVLTHLDKVLYPETGTTKADVLAYYAEIAHVLIPHAANRPATRKRWVHGVGTATRPGQVFFQKNLDHSTPPWVKRRAIQHEEHTNQYPLVNDVATLTWLAQTDTLEIHVPQWQFGRTGVPHHPDRLVLDLDPGEGVGLTECAEVARWARAILSDIGLDPMPVTSGSKGIHLYATLDGTHEATAISALAHELARSLQADHPDLVVSDMKKALRRGKVLVDWSQNNASKTTVAPYSLRGRSHPTVAAPRTWRELGSPKLRHLELGEVLARVRKRGDPLAALEPTPVHVEGLETGGSSDDRLATYRSKRDAKRTPEPVPVRRRSASTEPAPAGQAPGGQSFVIQEHHARNLHYDFRLEHRGVLVSWALPKGVPTDPGKNHLAVQTEDHPLEYGTFEGTIPRGEYGGGEVSIWDAGTYQLHKWREGKEIIVTLHGEDGGGLGEPRKYALIHTGGDGRAQQHWLIHLMVGHGHPGRPPSTATDAPGAEPTRHEPTPARHQLIAPMLATLGSPADLGEDDEWVFEMKWDGVRAIAYVEGGELRLVSRNGIDMTATYPDLGELATAVTGDAVLDGEIVALDRAGRSSFGRLQTRMKLTARADVAKAMAATPVHLMLFDLLERDGRSWLRRPYTDRRHELTDTVATTPNGRIQVPPAFDGDIGDAMDTSRDLGFEGVVAKRQGSIYVPGRRSRAWIKVKHHHTQEVVIGGWRPGKGRRANGVGSLLMGIPDRGQLRYVGRVGTGFTDRQLDEVHKMLGKLARKTSPLIDVPPPDASDARWVAPSLVGEVEFAEWTPDRRLRQPSWRGWRPDKSPDEVVREG